VDQDRSELKRGVDLLPVRVVIFGSLDSSMDTVEKHDDIAVIGVVRVVIESIGLQAQSCN